MSRTIVGVLRGGTGNEYDLSLKTGSAILNALPDDDFNTRDILIDKKGVWYSRGIPMDPIRALAQVDVVVNGLHGGVGEDGSVARMLRRAGVPFTGSDAMPSAASFNKIRARDHFQHAGLLIPQGVGFTISDGDTASMARHVFSKFGPPYMVKPAQDGASAGLRLAYTVIDLPKALADVLDVYGSALVEEFIIGKEATVGVIEHFRDQELYALPPAHVVYPEDIEHVHFDHYQNGSLRYLAPSDFSFSEKDALVEAAKTAHRALGLSHFSRADLIMTNRGPYLLEVNSLPGLYDGAALPVMLDSVGSSVPEFIKHSLALSRL